MKINIGENVKESIGDILSIIKDELDWHISTEGVKPKIIDVFHYLDNHTKPTKNRMVLRL